MVPKVERIISLTRMDERYCNVCCRHTDEKKPVNELRFGHNNQSMTVMLCDECLSDFADKLWEYLEEIT